MNSDPMLAAVDIVGLLIFAIIVAISAFLKKKEAEQEEEPAPPVRRRPEPVRREGMNNGQRPAPAPIPPPLPQSARHIPPPEPWGNGDELVAPKKKRELAQSIDHELREMAQRELETPVPVVRPRTLVKPPVALTKSGPRHSRDGAQAVTLLQGRRTVRQAFIASQVFGPPKALEQSQI